MSAPRTETSFPFIREWFEKAATTAAAQGRRDSAQLWRDGLQHLDHFKAQLDAAQTAAYAEGRKDEREEWEKLRAQMLKALQGARDVLAGFGIPVDTGITHAIAAATGEQQP